jgi:crotonobetainyl-CoA:carnitine CoA-transferase CaiB-like acyl-CoA transferase
VRDAGLRAAMGAAGRRRAEELFQWGRAFTQLVAHYNEAIAFATEHPLKAPLRGSGAPWGSGNSTRGLSAHPLVRHLLAEAEVEEGDR